MQPVLHIGNEEEEEEESQCLHAYLCIQATMQFNSFQHIKSTTNQRHGFVFLGMFMNGLRTIMSSKRKRLGLQRGMDQFGQLGVIQTTDAQGIAQGPQRWQMGRFIGVQGTSKEADF